MTNFSSLLYNEKNSALIKRVNTGPGVAIDKSKAAAALTGSQGDKIFIFGRVFINAISSVDW